MRRLFLITLATFLILPSKVFAGGGLVMLTAYPNIPDIRLHPGEFYTVEANVYVDNTYTTKCQQCSVSFKFKDPISSDVIDPKETTTDSNGIAKARMTSNILGDRLVYAEVRMPDNSLYTSSSYLLSYNRGYMAPTKNPTPTVATTQEDPTVAPTTSDSSKANIPTPTIEDKRVEDLNKKVSELENKLAQSEQKRSALEQKFNDLISWLKSHLLFFK